MGFRWVLSINIPNDKRDMVCPIERAYFDDVISFFRRMTVIFDRSLSLPSSKCSIYLLYSYTAFFSSDGEALFFFFDSLEKNNQFNFNVSHEI